METISNLFVLTLQSTTLVDQIANYIPNPAPLLIVFGKRQTIKEAGNHFINHLKRLYNDLERTDGMDKEVYNDCESLMDITDRYIQYCYENNVFDGKFLMNLEISFLHMDTFLWFKVHEVTDNFYVTGFFVQLHYEKGYKDFYITRKFIE